MQKMGGFAALINGAAYIVGFGMVILVLGPVLDYAPADYVAYLANNQALMVVWHLIIYLVAGVFMVPMVLGLHERLKSSAPALMQMTTAFGLIWAGLVIASGMLIINDLGLVADLYSENPVQAELTWLVLSAVESGLGGGVELPGGLWVLLVSWSAMQTRALPRLLNVLGVVVGIAGIVTVVPALYEAGTVFGLGCIVWFLWVGVVMLRRYPFAAAQTKVAQPSY